MYPPPVFVMFYADPVRHTLLDDILRELLQKNAIRKAPPNTCALFSRVCLVPKKNGNMRLVIDLLMLNE